ncbi:MAG: hypothetical protein HRU70_00655 [Phycisphaeraceae bacterium]|nr:MAG: hypothetical protein HRU70_00655 [Phycisphaeraceae bacterium]
MNRWGTFNATREIGRRGLGVEWETDRADESGASLVVSTTDEVALLDDPAYLESRSAEFIEAAELQRALASSGGAGRWRPVVATGRGERGAYYAAPRVVSVEDLVDGAVNLRPTSAQLRSIVAGVLAGLVALDRHAGRPHGMLSARCVVLPAAPAGVGPGVQDLGAVMLTDPKPSARVRPEDRIEDLRAVGRLIHRLVLGRDPVGESGGAIPMSPSWRRLTGSGPAWLTLCNRLLSLPGDSSLTPAEVEAALPAATASPEVKSRRVKRVALFVVVALSAQAAWLALRPEKPPLPETIRWSRIVRDWVFWAGPEAREAIRGEIGKIPGLGPGVGPGGLVQAWAAIEAETMPPAEIAGQGPDAANNPLRLSEHGPLTWVNAQGEYDAEGNRRLIAAGRLQRDVEEAQDALVAWLTGLRAGRVAESWAGRGWEGPASWLTEADAALRAITAREFAGGETELPARPTIARAVASVQVAGAIESLWGEVEATSRRVASDRDAILSASGRAVSVHALRTAEGLRETSALVAFRDGLAEGQATLREIESRLETARAAGWSYEEFLSSPRHREIVDQEAGGVVLGSLRAWVAASREAEFAPAPGFDLRGGQAGLTAEVQRVGRLLDAATNDPNRRDEVAARGLAGRFAEASRTAERLAAMPIVTPARLAGFESDAAAVRRVLAMLEDPEAGIPPPETLAQVIDEFRAKAFVSPGASSVWARAVDDAGATARTPLAARRRLAALAGVLTRIEGELVAPVCGEASVDSDAFAAVAGARRLDAVNALAESVDAASPPDPERYGFGPARDAFEAWSREAVAWCGDSARLNAALRAGVLDEEVVGGGGRTLAQARASFVADASRLGLEGAAAPLASRFATLEALAGMAPEGLVRASMESGGDRSVALTAWVLLSRSGSWPGSVDELDGAARAYGAVVSRFAGDDAGGRIGVAMSGARTAWLKFYRLAASGGEAAARLPGVFAASGSLGFAGAGGGADWDAVRSALERETREGAFNLDLWLARDEFARAVEGEERAAASAVGAALTRLAQSSARIDRADPLRDLFLKRMARAAEDPTGVVKDDPDRMGPRSPGAAGRDAWRFDEGASDSDVYVYRTVDGRHTIEFRRVEGQDVMLSTREVTLGLFIDTVSAAGQWPTLSQRAGQAGREGEERAEPTDVLMLDWRLTPEDAELGDKREGPLVWRARAAGEGLPPIAPAVMASEERFGGWYRYDATFSGIGAWPGYSAPGAAPLDPPDAGMPMTWVSPEASVIAARLLGCRLPSSAEWGEALRSASSGGANLRDAAWLANHRHVTTLRAQFQSDVDPSKPQFKFPARGIFWPPAVLGASPAPGPAADGTPAVESDDGVLFFRPAAHPGSPLDQTFRDMIGNAAEYVYEDGDVLMTLPEGSPSSGLERAFPGFPRAVRIAGRYDAVRVVGGSALSPPSGPAGPYDVRTAYGLKPTTGDGIARQVLRGWSDVGFRLALPSTGREHPVRMARRALERARFEPGGM